MNSDLTITPAAAEEWPAALDLLLQHLPAVESVQRRANVLVMRDRGEIPADSILVARRDGKLSGALFAMPLPGASSLVWPPQVLIGVDPQAVADPLVRLGLDRLRCAGARIAHALIAGADLPLAAPLLRSGFSHATRMLFLCHSLQPGSTWSDAPNQELSFEPYQPANQQLFHEALEQTYQGSLDIPELNGRRSLDEVIAGHRGQGGGEGCPERWWLARRQDGAAAGVLMLSDAGDAPGWELAYLGVVPAERGQGVGRSLAARALKQAFEAGAPQLMVAVDQRNRPARQLYEKIGFIPVDEREVLLFFFADLADESAEPSPKIHATT